MRMFERSPVALGLAVLAGVGAMLIGLGITLAQDRSALRTLREVGPTEINAPPAVLRQLTPADGFDRAYRQQPPLIPHKIDTYQVTIAVNQCMECHDWPNNTRHGAPKASETHYVDREGVRLDKIAGTRYFCTQCHVPQVDARPLVGNQFQNATQIR